MPKRKKSTGKFDFCVIDEDIRMTYPVGYCAEYFGKGNRDGHHDNPEQATQCFLKYIFEHGIDYDQQTITMMECTICKDPTMRCAAVKGQHENFFWPLCKEHLNESSIKIIHSRVSYEIIPEFLETGAK